MAAFGTYLSGLQATMLLRFFREGPGPFAGTVDKIFPKEGEMAGPGFPVIEFVSLGKMTIKADVSETYINQDTVNEHGEYQFSLRTDNQYKIVFEKQGDKEVVRFTSTQGFINTDTIKMEDVSIEYIPKTPFIIKNIYYDYDDDKILPDAEQDLSVILELMNQYKDMVIELKEGMLPAYQGTVHYHPAFHNM